MINLSVFLSLALLLNFACAEDEVMSAIQTGNDMIQYAESLLKLTPYILDKSAAAKIPPAACAYDKLAAHVVSVTGKFIQEVNDILRVLRSPKCPPSLKTSSARLLTDMDQSPLLKGFFVDNSLVTLPFKFVESCQPVMSNRIV